MNMGRGIKRRFLSAVTLALFMANFAAPAFAAPSNLGVIAEMKGGVMQDDVDEVITSQRKNNVLFLIEATAAMSFTPKGVMPQVQMTSGWDDSYVEAADWNETRARFGYGPDEVNTMMRDATFGMGALPPAWSGKNVRPERNLYGRDIDAGNNFVMGSDLASTIELNKYNYYFPFLSAVNAINSDTYGAGGGIYRSQKSGL